jgi:hypothetical protein
MKPFSEKIEVDGETLNFSFYGIHTIKGEKIFVAVTRNRQSYAFDMIKGDSGRWKIIEPYPKWVKPFEGQLSYIIDQNI